MKKLFALLVCAVALSWSGALTAADLPKSGTINFHTGWLLVGEDIEVAKGQYQGHGKVVGATFNDAGEGPLHGGAAECFYTYFATEGVGSNKGYCAFGDADGDRIFTDWTGKVGVPDGDEGINVIAGGTGKYAGITGSGPWKCNWAGTNGGSHCRQSLEYKLP